MRFKYLLLLSIVLFQTPSFAQREFGICDSTFYILNNDTTLIAGRSHLYTYSNNTLNVLYDFSTLDTNEYIRDFDIIKPDLWYTVVGLRYIGGPTRLYKSTNRGQIWSLDTSHYNTPNLEFVSQQFIQSINNLQHLNGDTLIMFMHYYESGIIYSTDLGLNWTKWFDNLISHYQGMFECDNKYYIFGYEGDGFRASMFGFDKNLLFSSDSTGLWNSFNNMGFHPPCYQGSDTLRCIYAPGNLTRCGAYNFFKNKINTLCAPVSTIVFTKSTVKIYPNPFNGKINTEGTTGGEIYALTNLYGQMVWSGKQIAQQDFYDLTSGIYFLTILTDHAKQTLKLIKE